MVAAGLGEEETAGVGSVGEMEVGVMVVVGWEEEGMAAVGWGVG